MREEIEQGIRRSLEALRADKRLSATEATVKVTEAKDKAHGDLACNIALILAKQEGMAPRDLAELIVDHLPELPGVERIEVANPGFINFFLAFDVAHASLRRLLATDLASLSGTDVREPRGRALIEFVSANPTGPLHVGHGRGAAYGACLADMLKRLGWQVEREYYVNDAGRQIDILTLSVWLRYLALGDTAEADRGADENFPQGAYYGDYIWDLAAQCRREYGSNLERELAGFERPSKSTEAEAAANSEAMTEAMTDSEAITEAATEAEKEKNEAYLTAFIARAKAELGDGYDTVKQLALTTMREKIESELRDFGVRYDHWFSEYAAAEKVDDAIALLKKAEALYEEDGALWFSASRFGDTKDRVLIRSDGQATYFATDIAYHLNKYRRGYDRIINIWGADHHGYAPRLQAALRAMGLDVGKLRIILVQFVNLFRDGVLVPMSTRSGEFVPLKELCDEVGVDAARFFYVERKATQHMDFDLSLAKKRDNENPLYYVQYAHARICSVFRQLADSQWDFDAEALADTPLSALSREDEVRLMRVVTQYADALSQAAENNAPHRLTRYLQELAGAFHAYYNDCRFLVDDAPTRNARLLLITATRKVIADGLCLIGVGAPDKM